MNVPKRNYYRNWYQQWQEEKKMEEKQQAMQYFSQMEDTTLMTGPQEGTGELYMRQGQLYQKGTEIPVNMGQSNPYGSYQPRQEEMSYEQGQPHQYEHPLDGEEAYLHQRRQNPGSKKRLSRRQSRQLQDILRGLMVGLPVVLVMLALLYAFDFIPQDAVNRWFVGNDPAVVALTQTHSQLMGDFNEINQRIAGHITGGTLTPETIAALENDYANIRGEVEAFVAANGEVSSLTRPWSLKLQSLGMMVTALSTQQQLNDEVIATYNQFVTDQNEIGTELTRALTQLLTENNISFRELPGGGLSIQ